MQNKKRQALAWRLIAIAAGLFLGAMYIVSTDILGNGGGQLQAAELQENTLDRSPYWPHKTGDLQPDPKLFFGRLDNGLRYVLLPNREPRDRVSLHLNVQAGSLNESEDQRGLAHFLEHLLFCGSTHFPPGELVKYFQKIGMQFGPDANAHTGFQETVYDVLLPDGKPASLAQGLLVLSDYAQGAQLLPTEVARESKVILSEMRARDTTAYRILDASFQFEFAGTQVAQRLPIGLEDIIKRATSQELKNFYDTWYRPETMILVIVGDFSRGTVIPLIEKYFSAMTARAAPLPEPEIGVLTHTGVKTFYHHEKEAGKTTVSIETLRQRAPAPDTSAAQRKIVIQNVADQIVQNRLDRVIAKGTAPFTTARIGSGLYLQRFDYAELTAESSPEQWAATLAFMEKTLRQVIQFGFTAGELQRVKKDYLADLEVAVTKADTRDSQALARQIIGHLNNGRVFQSPTQRLQLLQPILTALTPQEVHQAMKQTWADDQRLILVTGNVVLDAPGIVPEQAILEVYHQSAQVAVSAPEALELAVFPYLPEPQQSGKIVSRVTHDDLGITQIQFANGVYLNFKQTAFKANEVQATLSFGRGRMSQPASQPGLTELSEAVVNASGLGALDKEALNQALAGSNTEVTFDIAEDHFAFKGQTVSKNVERLFQLFYAHLLDPAFRPEALALSTRRLEQQYESYHGSVEGTLRLAGDRFLAGGDRRFGFPRPSEWEQLTLEQVQAWVGRALASESLELSVVGDCDLDVIAALASRYFGTLESRPAWQTRPRLSTPRFPVSQTRKIEVPTKIPRGLVVVAYLTNDFWDIHRTRRLSVLAEVVSDRLRIGIREKRGASYSPFAFNRPSRTYTGYGLFQNYIQVDPDAAEMVVQAVKAIIEDLLKQGIADEELRRAVDPVLTGLKDLRRSNAYWLNSVMTNASRHPQQIEWSRSMLDDYAAVTSAELMGLAQQYLHSERAAVVTIVPEFTKD